jgi:uncharacterized SAM-binding protein YcdF (DUF218 family)
MFFVASKILGFLSLPSNLLVILGLAGVLMIAVRKTRAGLSCLVATVLLLAICGLSPLGNLLMLVLEDRFPPWSAAGVPPDGIVMLGGALDPMVEAARGQVALNEAAERLTSIVELARQYPSARIVLSGGIGRLDHTGTPKPSKQLACSRGWALRSRDCCWKIARAIRTKMLAEARQSLTRTPASAGCW